jgi:death-on-curing protein
VSIEFLEIEHILALHTEQIDEFGGSHGVRDHGLLKSALAQPQATFGGVYLHDTLFDMAAAYLYHLVSNHPFIDGNKRIGLQATLVFLDLNGERISRSTSDLYELTLSVAQSQVDKPAISARLRQLAKKSDS